MAVPRQIIFDLVEDDDAPDLEVRFSGMDLSEYSSIVMKISREDGTILERTVTPDGSDEELGAVAWQPSDLPKGRHIAEFVFTQSADSKSFTLPRRYPVILSVRGELGT